MTRIEVSKFHKKAFKEITREFGLSIELRWGESKYKSKTVLIGETNERMRQDWRLVTQHIMSKKGAERSHYCTVYYCLYSTGILVLKNHPYPYYSQWKFENPGMELDHILPRYQFPHLVFDTSNWQALTRKENREKKNKVRKKETREYLRRHA